MPLAHLHDHTKPLGIGTEIADLHYGWQEINAFFIIGEIVQWRWTDPVHEPLRKAWSALLSRACEPRMYTNKMLVIIAEPDHDDYWTAAWAYDSRGYGTVRLREREEAA